MTINAADGSSGGTVGVAVDVSGFSNAFGGGLVTRLRLARIPLCLARAAEAGVEPSAECDVDRRVVEVVDVDVDAGVVTADVEVPGVATGRVDEPVEPAAYLLMSVGDGADGAFSAMPDSALNPAWGNRATLVATIRVPSGTTIYEGAAASQPIEGGGSLLGGGSQVYIPRVDSSWLVPL